MTVTRPGLFINGVEQPPRSRREPYREPPPSEPEPPKDELDRWALEAMFPNWETVPERDEPAPVVSDSVEDELPDCPVSSDVEPCDCQAGRAMQCLPCACAGADGPCACAPCAATRLSRVDEVVRELGDGMEAVFRAANEALARFGPAHNKFREVFGDRPDISSHDRAVVGEFALALARRATEENDRRNAGGPLQGRADFDQAIDRVIASHSWDGDACTICGYDATDALAGSMDACEERCKAQINGRIARWRVGDMRTPERVAADAWLAERIAESEREETRERSSLEMAADAARARDAARRAGANAPIGEKVAHVLRGRQTREHDCHWPGCDEQVPPARWGCYSHWMRIPKGLRDRIWRAYAPGQERTMRPSESYVEAARAVQEWIAGGYYASVPASERAYLGNVPSALFDRVRDYPGNRMELEALDEAIRKYIGVGPAGWDEDADYGPNPGNG